VPGITWPYPIGWKFPAQQKVQYRLDVMTDPTLNMIKVTWYGQTMMLHYLGGKGPALVAVSPAGSPSPVSVADLTGPSPNMGLCRQLLHG
jgi:hypothetical protein